jgi:hypothetical protein
VGVKVYSVLPAFVVLIEEGIQVPLIPSIDVSGSSGAVSFWQYELGNVGKVGVRLLAIVTFREAGVAQLAVEDGVKR